MPDRKELHKPFKTLWVDLTMSMEWKGGVVGIVRTQLELACGLKRLDPGVRFSMRFGNGFAVIPDHELKWLLEASNVAETYLTFFGRAKNQKSAPKSIKVTIPTDEQFFHPYQDGDVVLAVGWMDEKKEECFANLKDTNPNIKVCYLIYDIIMIHGVTSHFYDKPWQESFKRYIKWISHHADFVLFGGETAKLDTQSLQAAEGWPAPPGRAVKFGTDIVKASDPGQIPSLLAEVGVTGPFIMCVGSLEPRKNHDTLYRAYLLVLEKMGDAAPQLVICGKPMTRVDDLVDSLNRDPRLKGKLILSTPTDTQLSALYASCQFTLLPSLYEGWNLTLPESLGQGKFCLTCDTPPLREIGQTLVDYVAPFDVMKWADKIIEYSTDHSLLVEREKRIHAEWPTLHWSDSAKMVYDAVSELARETTATDIPTRSVTKKPTIWMDLTLTYLQWDGGLNGIIRAELMLAHYLKKLAPSTRFFAYEKGVFFEIQAGSLGWLLDAADLAGGYAWFHDFWKKYEQLGSGFRNPIHGAKNPKTHEAYISMFPDDSILFFAETNSDATDRLDRKREALDHIAPGASILVSQLIYDMIPILFPHLHAEATSNGYKPLVELVSEQFDLIVYGGRTAQRDGIAYQATNGHRTPPSEFIEFGSGFLLPQGSSKRNPDKEKALIKALGVSGDYIMTVGTVEPRKNHELLYKAYLRIQEAGKLARPLQLVIVGKKGWKSDDFMETLTADARVEDKIIILTPTDEELRALYFNCRFTVLPSFYEGCSLTLPESLSFGKFCLVSDVAPLRETGGDLVEYIHPLDTFRWAERIEHYANHPEVVATWERRIVENWSPTSWRDATERLLTILHGAFSTFEASQPKIEATPEASPSLQEAVLDDK